MSEEQREQREGKATPRPWRIGQDPIIIESDHADFVAMTLPDPALGWDGTEEDYANARLIVRAVNAHDELVEATRAALDALENEPDGIEDHAFHDLATKLRAALAAAEED